MSHNYAVFNKATGVMFSEVHPTHEAAQSAIDRLLAGLPGGDGGKEERSQSDYVVVKVPR
jgi:hypothetical protein